MSKKSRRSRARHKTRSSPKRLAVKEVSQRPQSLPLSSKPPPVAKSTVTMAAELADRYKYVLSDLRRSVVTAAVLFVLLIVLYFFLR